MTHIKKTFESFINESKDEKDLWWEENYERLIDYVENSGIAKDVIMSIDPEMADPWNDSTLKHRALMVLHYLSIEEIENELDEFEEFDED